ncbi:MAG: hypothetical protein RI906_187, partial [Pseudomonadota bacterium]
GDRDIGLPGDILVTGRVNGSTGSADHLVLSSYGGTVSLNSRIGDGIGDTNGTTLLSGGNGYADGEYEEVPLLGGTGSGATANIKVEGGAVTQVTVVSVGGGYKVGDRLSVARSSLGDFVGVASGFELRVDALSNIERLTVSDALNVTFGERVFVDGDITIKASGKVVFSDQVVLRNGGRLLIEGAIDVEFLGELILETDTAGRSGSVSVKSSNATVSFVQGLFDGQSTGTRWTGVTALTAKGPEAAGPKGSLSVSGEAVVLAEVAGSARNRVDLDLDELTVQAESFALSATPGFAANLMLGQFNVVTAASVGSTTNPLKLNASRVSAQSTAGDINLESGAAPVEMSLHATGSARVNTGASIVLGNSNVAGSLTVSAGGAISDSGVLTVAGASSFTATGQTITLDSANDYQGAVSASAASLVLNDVNALSLGAVTLTGNLTITAGGAISDSGVLAVGGTSNFTAASQTVTLDSANDFAGAVSATASALTLNDINALDLGTVTVTRNFNAADPLMLGGKLTVSAGGAISDSGVLTVAGASSFTATGQTITLDSANDFQGAVSAKASALTLNDINALDLGTVAVTGNSTMAGRLKVSAGGAITGSGTIQASHLQASSRTGGVSLKLVNDPIEGVDVLSHNGLTLRTFGGLTLMPGSRLESKTGSVHVIVADDLLAYGTSLIGKQVILEAGGAIRGLPIEKPAPIEFNGELVLQAGAGIGGFEFDRLLVRAIAPNATVTAINGSRGDVVIATPDSMTISMRGVRSDSEGMVALLADLGSVYESGPVFSASGRVVRLTGTTWMSRTDTMAASLLTKSLNAESGPQSFASPLEHMNRLLRTRGMGEQGVSNNESRLSSTADALAVNTHVQPAGPNVDAAESRVSASGTASVSKVVRPLMGLTSTQQLLEAAMTLTVQGRNPALDGTEAISSWVNRIVTETPANPPTVESGPSPATPPSTILPPAILPPVDPKPDQSRDPVDGSPGAGDRPTDPVSGVDDSRVRWLVPVEAMGFWLESPTQKESELSGADSGLSGADSGDS